LSDSASCFFVPGEDISCLDREEVVSGFCPAADCAFMKKKTAVTKSVLVQFI
jgi:hypothetical protein